MTAATAAAARSYADFSVRFSELLFGDSVDVTQTHWGGINEELIIQTAVPVSAHAAAGSCGFMQCTPSSGSSST